MGISIDSVYTKWEKETKTLLRPVEIARLPLTDNLLDDFRDVWNLLAECHCPIYFENTVDAFYHEKKYELELTFSHRFFEKLVELKLNKNQISQWLVPFKGKHIAYDLDVIVVSDGFEYFDHEMWAGKEPVSIPEDGKDLFSAIENMKYMYNVDVSDALVYYEDVANYVKGHSPLDKTLALDLSPRVADLRKQLENLTKKEDDRFFEERLERFHYILNALEKNAKFVYSV